jgi:hypothetical protein
MMKPEKIEQKLEQLANALGTRDSFVDDVMSKIESSPVQPSKKSNANVVHRRMIMNRITKLSAAAVIIIGLLVFYNTSNSTLYAQAVKAMQKAKTVHCTGYGLKNGQMVKANEMWYKRNVGYKMIWNQKDIEKLMIDDGQHRWQYQTGQDFAVKSKSVTTEQLPREITETSRYLDKCVKEQGRTELIDGFICQVYIGSYPEKEDTTRLIFWVDENMRPRKFEEKILENDVWKMIERVNIEYDKEINIAVFKPEFGSNVEIIQGDKVLDESFSLDNAIFTQEDMSLIFAVHEVRKCQSDVIFTVTSLRPNQTLSGRFISKGITAWNYGDYQFGPCYERLDKKGKATSYSPVKLAWFYRDGLLIQWTVFIPRGFEPGQVNSIKLELYYLYASGSWGAERIEKGLSDRLRFNPIATLPLPDNTVSLESQLTKTYNYMKLLEPMQAEKHLQLKSIPFTDEEMEQWCKDHPDSGIAKSYRSSNGSRRLLLSQSKSASQISYEDWSKDIQEIINKHQNR